MLTRYFVEEFLSVGSDTQTQLIFTTHDTNLLNGRLLPARAVWFVEKDDNGASRIHSLSEYKPEQLEYLLEHLEEGYLQGRFGAIPFIADRRNLRWQVREENPSE
jgi:AAA15 family ATPase/GTPase